MLPAAAWCQTAGSIEGTIFDPSGSTVSACRVAITEAATGARREAASGANGLYSVPGLTPGVYRIETTHSGFRTTVLPAVEVTAGRAVRADLHLQLGDTRESVTVGGEAPLVSVSASDWGGSIRRDQLAVLPLRDRNTFDLVAQQPGATIPTNTDASPSAGLGTLFSINGSRPWQNSFRLDGVNLSDVAGGAPASASGRLLGVEALEEVHLITSPFSAEYGRTAGGIFTAVSRSGSNQLHGSAYEFFRNESLDAKNYFDSPDARIPRLRRNQFGGMLAGPAVRDRLFWLANYEGFDQSAGVTLSTATLSADGRRGILSPGATPVAIAPAVRPFLDVFPVANGRDFGNGSAEYIARVDTDSREHFVTGKGDWLPVEKLRVSARYTFDRGEVASGDYFGLYRMNSPSRYQFLNSQVTWLANAASIFNFRSNVSRVRNQGEHEAAGELAKRLTFLPGHILGGIRVVGLSETGSGPPGNTLSLPRKNSLTDYQVHQDAVLIRGSHTVRFGAGYNRVRLDQRSDSFADGVYRFNSIAEFLRGQARAADLMAPGSDTVRNYSQHLFHFFLQDEWKITRRIQLSLGARYEPYTVPSEANNKVATLLDPRRDSAPTVGGKLFQNPSRGNLAPRGAIAWDLTGDVRTVIRAGAGIFQDLISTRDIQLSGVRMPPFYVRLSPQRPAFPGLLSAAATTAPSISADSIDYYLLQPYVAQFQLRVERQIGASTVLQAGYAGSRGVHLMGFISNINTTVPQRLADGRLFFPATNPRINPAYQQMNFRQSQFDSNFHALNLSLQRRLRRGLQFQGKYSWSKSIDDNSIMLRAEYLSDNGFPAVHDFRSNRSVSDYDRRHDAAANFVWNAPRIAGGWELDGTLRASSGHPFNPTVGFDQARLRPSSSDQGQRPDLVPGFQGSLVTGDVNRWFNPAAFALPQPGFLGNLGRNTVAGPGLFALDLAIRKDIWRGERHAVTARVEAYNVTNRPNFATPAIPDLALYDSTGASLPAAGRITSTTTPSRQLQLSLRWAF